MPKFALNNVLNNVGTKIKLVLSRRRGTRTYLHSTELSSSDSLRGITEVGGIATLSLVL